ncbi:MAG: RdgB/HAM1 family non-canonical purine NTP pyrophosphatase [Kiritimatiellae bacterium]|nr:RdgB/HAM1 family non-canonical purine NTP pyrophosphatase [Kiritimatiellia bacterium]
MKLYVATHNVHKLREIGEILPGYEIVADDPDVEETAPDFAGNALIKVRAIAARHPGAWSMADDSGLEVRALGGAPGVRSARYAGEPSSTPANNALLLKNLEGVADRAARFTCTVALVDPEGREHVVTGHCPGRIAHAPSGTAGFGYDPLFIPDGHEASFADLGEEAKNKISHRGRALAQVKALLAGCPAPNGVDRAPSPCQTELTLADVCALLRAGNRVLLMTRHAERPHIDHEDPSFGATLPLTADGEEMSRAFGRILRDFASVVQFASSPLRRTMMTTECIAEGMGHAHPDISPEDALGNGTFYFADPHAVWEEFRDGSFFRKCFAYFEKGTFRGFAELHAATDALEEWCLAHFTAPFAVFTTHDLYIAAFLAARTVISRFTEANWPRFLDSAAIILAPDGTRRYALVRAGLSDRVTGV